MAVSPQPQDPQRRKEQRQTQALQAQAKAQAGVRRPAVASVPISAGGRGGAGWVGHLLPGPQVSSALLPFFGEGSPTKIDYGKKGALILTSLLEDLVLFRGAWDKWVGGWLGGAGAKGAMDTSGRGFFRVVFGLAANPKQQQSPNSRWWRNRPEVSTITGRCVCVCGACVRVRLTVCVWGLVGVKGPNPRASKVMTYICGDNTCGP